MKGRFIAADEAKRESAPWGRLGWLSRPSETAARELVVIEVELEPGRGHDFHRHPDQEEVIYVVSGEITQWIERDPRTLRAGDSAFIQRDAVHASFNDSREKARFLAILAPAVGEAGYELVDVAAEEPWRSVRS